MGSESPVETSVIGKTDVACFAKDEKMVLVLRRQVLASSIRKEENKQRQSSKANFSIRLVGDQRRTTSANRLEFPAEGKLVRFHSKVN